MHRIKILDSCRGLAALIVVFHHVYTRFGRLYPDESKMKIHGLLNFISDLNVMAVLFFFVLSGFSIRLSLKNGLPVKKPLLNEYLYRRFKRIIPLYLMALGFTFISGLLIQAINTPEYSVKNLIGNLLFLQTSRVYKGYWFSPYGENGPLWSLSFEMFYYLFFPVFVFALMKLLRVKSLNFFHHRMALCIAFVLSTACIFINNMVFFPYIAFAKLFFVWYSGFFLANLYVEKRIGINIDFWLNALLLAFLGLLLFLKKSDSLHELFTGAAIATFFYIIYAIRNYISGPFISKAEQAFNFLFFHIGKGSYALYLLHYPLILILLSYENTTIWMVVLAMLIIMYLSIQLEEFFIKKKFLLLRLQYIR